MPLTVRAAAKLNLHLGVGAPGEDGYHPLDTVFQAVSLYDDVQLLPASEDTMSVEIVRAGWVQPYKIPIGDQDLSAKAMTAAMAHAGIAEPQPHIVVQKSIPVAGGMAGGSADAAATLIATDRWFDLGITDDDLLGLAADLGSDVPFMLLGGTARATGRGEILEAVDDEGPWWWVLAPSRDGLSTPAVYQRFDELHPDAGAPTSSEPVLDAIATATPEALARALHNDLQEAALDLRPDLRQLIDKGESLGALRGIVSGSGPTVAFLCGNPDEARALVAEFTEWDPDGVYLIATGPVAGAHLVTIDPSEQ